MLSGLVASAVLVLGVCDNPKVSLADVEKHLVTEVLPSPEKSGALESDLKAGKGLRCREVLTEFLRGIEAKKERPDFAPVRTALLALAANGGVAGSLEVIERDVSAGRGEDFLDVFNRASPVRYRGALRVWLRNATKQIVAKSDKEAGSARVVSPLFLERFLQALAQSKETPMEADCANLNVIFAVTSPGHREVFLPLYGAALRGHAYTWILAFRKEPVAVQVKLFPIFEAVGGPEVVKELMWLSQNHGEERVRALAERSLNKVLQNVKKN